jgi:hypothetical protein
MKSIPAFSKKTTGGGISTGPKIRSGFTPNVTVGAAKKATPVKNMAASYPVKSTLTKTTPKGNPGHPSHKSGSGKAGKSVPAFSKKKI